MKTQLQIACEAETRARGRLAAIQRGERPMRDFTMAKRALKSAQTQIRRIRERA